jgi:lipopolysaccharide/colanic/teichoic acid biosynthesis glycosyltransferase
MPGAIYFIQNRVGKDGNEFKLLKFRSMNELTHFTNDKFEVGDKSRVTRLGKILRRSKLDELPQLVNVLIGDMSLVGPRPEVKQWTEVYPEIWAIVHKVKPGITDPASIHFRNEEEILSMSDNPEKKYKSDILPKKLGIYIDYVNNQSLMGDIGILFKTIFAVFFK